MGLHRAARQTGELLSGTEASHAEVEAIPKTLPVEKLSVESRARGSYTGADLLGGVLAVLLLARFVFVS